MRDESEKVVKECLDCEYNARYDALAQCVESLG